MPLFPLRPAQPCAARPSAHPGSAARRSRIPVRASAVTVAGLCVALAVPTGGPASAAPQSPTSFDTRIAAAPRPIRTPEAKIEATVVRYNSARLALANAQRKAAAARTRSRQTATATSSRTTSSRAAAAPTASRRAKAAVAAAHSALGRPYSYGSAGPRSFDCSGLTMWSWARARVGLPHSSRSQYRAGARVGKAALRPGDLLFFYSPISHVGMYIGRGRMIHAPNSGAVARIATPRSGSYVGAVRPG